MLRMGASFCFTKENASGLIRIGHVWIGLAPLWLGCSVDLHEATGPIVPVPNLQGQVLRHGSAVSGLRVRLEDETGKTIESERTDERGQFGFAEVGKGRWVVRVESDVSSDFSRTIQTFNFFSPDTFLTLPTVDVDLRDLHVLAPEDSTVSQVPGFFLPLNFSWEGHLGSVRVQFFETSEGGGRSIWYSVSANQSSARWNGLGTENEHVSVPVAAGEYRWRLQVEEAGGLEYLTHFRHITLAP